MNKMIFRINILIILFSALLFSSCAPSLNSLYKGDYPLTSHRVFSRVSDLSFKIPEGWYAAEDNEKNIFDIWLVNNEYSATMGLIPINIDEQTHKNIVENGLGELLSLSKKFKSLEGADKFEENLSQEFFDYGDLEFASYQYIDKGKNKNRAVVFIYKNQPFEFTASCENFAKCDTAFMMNLFNTQNSVLTSLKQ